MDSDLVRRLNQLNLDFYQKVSANFDETRQQAWPGWTQLQPYLNQFTLNNSSSSALDIGCGNGRWGSFLHEHMKTTWSYFGLDSNAQLLAKADKRLAMLNIDYHLAQLDLVDNLLANSLIDQLFSHFSQKSFDLVTLFGVLHHLPSRELRHRLFDTLYSLLNPGGILIFTTWQFTQDATLLRRQTDPHTLNLPTLEENDYILDWQRGQTAHRYCHLIDQTELQTLLSTQSWQILAEFDADGKEQLNHYVVIQKKLAD